MVNPAPDRKGLAMPLGLTRRVMLSDQPTMLPLSQPREAPVVPRPRSTHACSSSCQPHELGVVAQRLSSPATIPNLFGVKPCTQIRQAKAPDLMFT